MIVGSFGFMKGEKMELRLRWQRLEMMRVNMVWLEGSFVDRVACTCAQHSRG